MLKTILLAAGISLAVVPIAGAVTPVMKPGVATTDVVQVKKHWKGDDWRWGQEKALEAATTITAATIATIPRVAGIAMKQGHGAGSGAAASWSDPSGTARNTAVRRM